MAPEVVRAKVRLVRSSVLILVNRVIGGITVAISRKPHCGILSTSYGITSQGTTTKPWRGLSVALRGYAALWLDGIQNPSYQRRRIRIGISPSSNAWVGCLYHYYTLLAAIGTTPPSTAVKFDQLVKLIRRVEVSSNYPTTLPTEANNHSDCQFLNHSTVEGPANLRKLVSFTLDVGLASRSYEDSIARRHVPRLVPELPE